VQLSLQLEVESEAQYVLVRRLVGKRQVAAQLSPGFVAQNDRIAHDKIHLCGGRWWPVATIREQIHAGWKNIPNELLRAPDLVAIGPEILKSWGSKTGAMLPRDADLARSSQSASLGNSTGTSGGARFRGEIEVSPACEYTWFCRGRSYMAKSCGRNCILSCCQGR
jgi:hypothetical protein